MEIDECPKNSSYTHVLSCFRFISYSNKCGYHFISYFSASCVFQGKRWHLEVVGRLGEEDWRAQRQCRDVKIRQCGIFISLTSRRCKVVTLSGLNQQDFFGYKVMTNFEKGGDMKGQRRQRRRESRDRVHSCICIFFLKHLMIKNFMVLMNDMMF